MDSFSAQRLKKIFEPLRAHGVVRSQVALKDMHRAAHGVFLEADPKTAKAAYLLSSVLWDIAEDFWEGPVQEDDVYATWRVMSQPVIRTVDLIIGVETDEEAILSDLVLSFAKTLNARGD